MGLAFDDDDVGEPAMGCPVFSIHMHTFSHMKCGDFDELEQIL